MLCDTRDTEGPHGRGRDCGGLAKKEGSFMEEDISKGPSTRGGLDEWRITGGPQLGLCGEGRQSLVQRPLSWGISEKDAGAGPSGW